MALTFDQEVVPLDARRYSLRAVDGDRVVTFISDEKQIRTIYGVSDNPAMDLSNWLRPGGKPRQVFETRCRAAYKDGENASDEIHI